MLTVKLPLHLVSDHEGKRALLALSDVFYYGNQQDIFFLNVSVNSSIVFSHNKLNPARRKRGLTQDCFKCV